MASPYHEIGSLMLKLSINDDSIVLDKKIRDLTEDFKLIVREDEHMLKDALMYFNEEALADSNFAMNFALFFSSRTLDSIVLNGSKIRAEMLNVLQRNFTNADNLRLQDPKKFYNSITLLGEYYHRARIADKPVKILGQSLLQLLTEQLQLELVRIANEPQHVIDAQFSKLIVTQISLNGPLARPCHKTEIEALLFEIRKCLIEVSTLTAKTKAMLLMTLDLYYSNFTNVGRSLEKLYAKFLVEDNEHTTKCPEKGVAGQPTQVVSLKSSSEVSSLSGLKTEMRSGIGTSAGRPHYGPRLNKEYIGRPLKASDRLTYVRKHSVPEVRQEHEEIAQEKLFEQQFEDLRNRSANVLKERKMNEESTTAGPPPPPPLAIDTIAEDDDGGNAAVAVTPSPPTKSTKERRADKAHFLVRPMSSRQRLKPTNVAVPVIQHPPPELSDWYEEVESHNSHSTPDVAQISPKSNASTTNSSYLKTNNNLDQSNYDKNQLENAKNHWNISPQHSHSNYSNPVSPNESQRHNLHNHSFRSSKSDRSTQSVDRNLESNYGYKVFENRRNRNGGGGGGGNNYNNYGSNTWGRGNRNKYRNGGGGGDTNNQNNKDKNYATYDRYTRNQQNGGGGGGGVRSSSYSENFGRKSPIPSANQNKYQRQQSVESEGGVQKRFNLQNNRQFHNSTSSFTNTSSGGGGSGGNNNNNSNPTSGSRYQSKNGHRQLQRSTSKQNDDENWNNSYNAAGGRHTFSSKSSTRATAQYSQDFLKYLDD